MPRRPPVTHVSAPEYPMRTRASPGVVTTLEALEVLADSDRPMTFTEVARRLDASAATVHRVLAILVDRGYAWRSRRTGRFALGLRLFQLAHAHDPVSRATAAIDGRIQHLCDELGHIAYAAMLDEDRLVVIAAAHPPRHVGFRVAIGCVVPALHAGVGRLLPSQTRPNTLPRLLARSQEFQRLRRQDRIELHASLPEMRACRCVLDGAGLAPGIRDTAVLVGSGREGLMVALAVAIPDTQRAAADHAALSNALRSHGTQIALELGVTAPSRERPPDR